MNSEPIPSPGPPAFPVAGATLQAVLQLNDGGMDSIAVPVPLPEVVIRLRQGTTSETRFRRARSPDSVVRYAEEVAMVAEGAASLRDVRKRQCGRCGEVREVYYVPKLRPEEPVTPATAGYCDACYPKAAV